MAQADHRRTLEAILSADVAGYSRLMQDDEEATVKTLTNHRAVFREHIARHVGRIIDTAGDSILAVFDSVVEAVQCAIDIQAQLAAKNDEIPENRRMHFRIGINLGDVIEQDDGTIYGDAVNIAARLESLARPGGVMVSGTVFEQAENKLQIAFKFAGEQEVKNISKPVRAYRVVDDIASSSEDNLPTLPDKPSIAVLPFDNLSGESDQEYFADGISEDLITELSRLRWLFVTARNSSFSYKGQPLDIREVGEELGVRYVLEGSVRKGGSRVRISAQLIDAATGNHIWAERYDRDLSDIFALQDEITETLVAELQIEMGESERERAIRKRPENLDSWESYQRGLWHLWKFGAEDMRNARQWFRRSSEYDEHFALAYAAQAYALVLEVTNAHVDAQNQNLDQAIELARKSISLDEKEPIARYALGRALALQGKADAAVDEMRAAIDINPNLAMAYHGLGAALQAANKLQEAIAALDTAIRLSPRDPLMWVYFTGRSQLYFQMEKYEAAVDDARRAIRHPRVNFVSHSVLASALAHLNRLAEARSALDELFKVRPDFSVNDVLILIPSPCPSNMRTAIEKWIEGLRLAGLDVPDNFRISDR